jgi:alkylation response protein AidB-like acyl-CoA dehydrogenase
MGHASIQITADVYGHLVPDGNRQAVDRLDHEASGFATRLQTAVARVAIRLAKGAGFSKEFGEPPRNRTENPQIKSLLLCQLS